MQRNGQLEFEVFYCKLLINWMLYHGTFDRPITEEELQIMEDEAKAEVQERVSYSFDIPKRSDRETER